MKAKTTNSLFRAISNRCKRVQLIGLVFAFPLFVLGQQAAGQATAGHDSLQKGRLPVPALKITHLTGDFYVYTTYHLLGGSPYPSNSLYLVTNAGVVMIDVPWDTAQYQPLLDSIQARHHRKVVLSVSTHWHSDRTCAIDFLKTRGVKTFSSRQTYELCREKHEPQAEFYFEKDTVFKVGQYTFQTYYGGEGHSTDNIVVWFPAGRVLYGGCLIKSTEADDLGNLSDANPAAWPATIRNVQQRFPNPAYVIPGHLDFTSTLSLEHTLQLLRQHATTTQ